MPARMLCPSLPPLSVLALPVLVAALGSAPLARAGMVTWTGAGFDSSWQTPQNWVNIVTPGTGDSLYFGGSITGFTARNNAADNAITLLGLTFAPGGAGDMVVAGSSFVLNGNITDTRSGGVTTIQNSFVLPDNTTPELNVGAGSFLTITGNITGRNNVLTKTGAGTLTLTGSNNYTRSSLTTAIGRTNIQEGTVVMGNASALGAIYSPVSTEERVTIGASGVLDLNGFGVSLANITGDSTGVVKNGSLNGYLGNQSVNVQIGGSGGLSVSSGGTVTVNSANTYTGTTYLSGGQLILNNANALGSTAAIAFTSGTLVYTAGSTTDYSSKLMLVFNPDTKFRVDTGGQTVTFASDIKSDLLMTHEFVKYGLGTLVLTGNNTNLNILTIQGGTVRFSNANNLCASGTNGYVNLVSGGNLQWAAGSTADISSQVHLNGGSLDTNGNNVTLATALTAGTLTKVGAGTLTLSNTNSYTGGTFVTGGTLKLSTGGAVGTIRGALSIGSGATVEAAAVDALGYIDNAKVNSVTVDGGTFNNTAAGDSGWGVAYTLSNGALLTSNGGVSSATSASMHAFGGPSTGNTSVNVTGGTNTIAGHMDLRGDNGNTNVNFTVASGATLNITAGISSHSPDSQTAGPVNLTKLGGGLMTLTGSNIFTGTTFVNGGLIEFNSNASFGSAANKVVLNGGGLRWAAGNTADVSSRFSAIGAAGATFDTNGNNVTLASVLSGSGALTKNGLGTLSLNTANTYTGGTVINSGTAVVAQTNALGSGAVRVQGGALNVQAGVTFSNSVALAGGAYNRTLTGDLTGKMNATSDLAGGRDTTASLLAGSLGAQSTLSTSFSATSLSANDNLRLSDVYSFVGTGTAIFVLQLSSASVGEDGMMVWLDNGAWENAIAGNTGNTATQAMQGFDGSYSQFLAAFSNPTLAQTLGAYGYDAATQSAWAVLNHNSDFAVVPEPGTAALVLLGGLTLLARRQRA